MDLIFYNIVFYNTNDKLPKQNERVLIKLNNQETYLHKLNYAIAEFGYCYIKGQNVFILDAGGKLSSENIIWSSLPKI